MEWQRRSLFSVFFIFFLDNFGYAVVFPILSPLLLEPSYHFLPEATALAKKQLLLGVLLTSFPIGQFIGAPMIGDLADSLGRKKLFYFTISGTILGLFLSAISIYLMSYTFLLLSRFFTGFFSGNLSICMASIADLSLTEKLRAKNYGIMTALAGISWSLAIFVGGEFSNFQLVKYFNPAIPFILTVIISIPSLFILHYFFHETTTITKKIKIDFFSEIKKIFLVFKDSEICLVFIGAFFWNLGWFFILQWTPAYLIERFKASVSNLTLFLIGMGLFWTLGSSVINRLLLKKFDSIKVVIFGLFFLIFLVFFMAFFNSFNIFIILNCFISLIGSFTWSNFSNTISLAGNSNEQGKLMGINQGIIALTEILAPLLGSFFLIIKDNLVYYASSICCIAALLSILLANKHFKKRSI